MSASPELPDLLGDAVIDVEEEPEVLLLWTDAGDTWWEPTAGAPSDRDR